LRQAEPGVRAHAPAPPAFATGSANFRSGPTHPRIPQGTCPTPSEHDADPDKTGRRAEGGPCTVGRRRSSHRDGTIVPSGWYNRLLPTVHGLSRIRKQLSPYPHTGRNAFTDKTYPGHFAPRGHEAFRPRSRSPPVRTTARIPRNATRPHGAPLRRLLLRTPRFRTCASQKRRRTHFFFYKIHLLRIHLYFYSYICHRKRISYQETVRFAHLYTQVFKHLHCTHFL